METQTGTNTTTNGNGVKAIDTSATLDVTGFPTAEEVEKRYLNLVLEKTGGNKVQAAKILGVSVKTIYNKLDGYRANEAVRSSTQGS